MAIDWSHWSSFQEEWELSQHRLVSWNFAFGCQLTPRFISKFRLRQQRDHQYVR